MSDQYITLYLHDGSKQIVPRQYTLDIYPLKKYIDVLDIIDFPLGNRSTS